MAEEASQTISQDQTPAETVKRSFFDGLGINGFCVMCAWHFIIIFSPLIGACGTSPLQGRPFGLLLALYAALAVTYFFIALFSKPLTRFLFESGIGRRRASIAAITFLATIASALVALLPNESPFWLGLLLYAFLGFSAAMLIFPWLQFPQQKTGKGNALYRNLALNMGIGGLLALLIGSFNSIFTVTAICLLPVISAITLLIRWVDEAEPEKSEEPYDSPVYFGEMIKSNVHFIIFGFAFAFIQGAFSGGENITFIMSDAWPLLGATASAFLIFFTPSKYMKSYGVTTFYHASLLFFFAGLLCHLAFATNQTAATFFDILFFCGFNIFDFSFMVFAFAWASTLKDGFPRFVGINRAMLYLGMALGLSCGFALSQFAAAYPSFQLMCATGVVVLLTFTTLPFFDELIPYARMSNSAEVLLAGTDITNTEDDDSSEDATKKEGRWRKRVDHIADEANLSDREREVFFYLAKGRNAAFIQQELWISIHTVKTHISNIYRKLDVHSIQEVLDLVDGEAGTTHTPTEGNLPHGIE